MRLHRDHWAGGLLMVVGLGAGLLAHNRPLGTLTEMGSGFFPMALSLLLALLGAMIALSAPRRHTALDRKADLLAGAPLELPLAPGSLRGGGVVANWRGWSCIVGGVAAFILLGYLFGLAPATFACVLISAFGDRATRLAGAVLLAAVVTVAGVFIFAFLLRVPFPVLQWGSG